MRLAIAISGVILLLAQPSRAQEPTVATGCINSAGRLASLALGDQPANECGANETQVTLQLASEPPENIVQPINIALEQTPDGADQPITLAENGPLSLVATCGTNSGTTELTLEIIGGDVFVSREVVLRAGFAGQSVVRSVDVGEAPAVTAADGSYLAVEDTTLLAVNVLGEDCLISGTFISF